MNRTTRKALLKVGYACNNNCVFCHSAPHRGHDSDLKELERKIGRAASLGAEMLVLSGGEPTIRRDLPEIVAAIKTAGMSLGLVSNGRMLAYPELVEMLIDGGLGYAYVSLCGTEPGIHDVATKTRSFDQVMLGLENLSSRIEDLTVNLVIGSWNISKLGDAPDLLSHLSPVRLKLSMLEPEGNTLADFHGLVPSLSEAAGKLEELAASIKDYPGLTMAVDGFPLCLLRPDLIELESGLREDGFFIMSEAFETDFFPVDESNRSFSDKCSECSYRRRCRGVFSQYLQRRGDSELRPVSLQVPNSFNLGAVDDSLAFDVENCPFLHGVFPPPDAVRGIAVITRPGKAQIYHAPTLDFADESIRKAIRDQGQVYLQHGQSPLPADFAKELGRLELCDACAVCRERRLCGGAWRFAAGPSFEHTNEMIGEQLSRIEGTVLDVGCGNGPYLKYLEPAVTSGKLDYLGIDPSNKSEELPAGFGFQRTGLGNFHHAGKAFDGIMAIRSLAHLPRIRPALEKISSLLRPGGVLILAEDVIFGLARSDELRHKVETLESLPFEHYTNLYLEEAETLAAGCGLIPEKSHGTGETDSTTWILVCRKSGD